MHPKLYFYPSQNSSFYLGWSGRFDKNWSGDLLFIKNGKSFDHQCFERNKLQRNTYELVYDQKFIDDSFRTFLHKTIE
ncbi:hypothetical protein ACK2M7_05230 [Chryseobacterium sp. TY4]